MIDFRLPIRAALIAMSIGSAAVAQGVTDPGDLAFWDAIKNSTTPAEYREYLKAYPTGRFAPLARIRAGADPTPDAGPPDYSISIAPTAGRVGQLFTAGCGNIPFGTSAYDKLIVVPAGSTVKDPVQQYDQVLWSEYASNCERAPFKLGPFAPGAYELRWMTTLLNNENPKRYELKAKAAFTVR